MSKFWDAVRGSAGFYVTMAVCLLVIGVSSYYLLTEKTEKTEKTEQAAPPAETQTAPPDTYVTAPAPELELEPDAESGSESASKDPPVVETLSPSRVEVPAPQMPEIDVNLDDTPVIAEAPPQTVRPLEGEVVTAFSMDQLLYNPSLQDWRTHDGVDIAAEEGGDVLAAMAGTVLSVTDDPLMGTTVVLQHDNQCQTVYANLQPQTAVEAGEQVHAGQRIGSVGASAPAEAEEGPHLHFSVTRDGESVDPGEFLG